MALAAQRDNYPPSGNQFDILWNPNGSQIAVTRNDEDEGIHGIEILEIPSLELAKGLPGNGPVTEIVWIDETRLASSGKSDFSIQIWNIETEEIETVLEGHSDGVFGLEYNPTNGLLASLSSDSSIRLWNLNEGVQVAQTLAHNRSIWSMIWSPDGAFIATGGWTHDPRIRIWNAANNDLVAVLEGHSDWIQSLSWHPDGQLLASGSADGTIKLWDTTTYTLVETLIDTTPEYRNDYSYRDIKWSPDGTMLASATTFDDRIWDVESGELIFLRETTYDRWGQNSVTWCSDGEIIAISLHAFIRIIDVEQQEISFEIEHPVYSGWQNEVLCYDEQLVVVGDSGAFIDLTIGSATREFSGSGVASWHPSGHLLATAHGNHIYMLSVDDLSTVATIDTGKPYSIDKIAWSPDGISLAVGFPSEDVIYVWGR